MSIRNLCLAICVATSTLLVNCARISVSTEESGQALPSVFLNGSIDSTSISSQAWKTYFKDSILVALIDTALQRNLDLRILTQRIEIHRQQVRFWKGTLLPTLDGVVGNSTRKFGLYTMDGAGNSTTDIAPGKKVPEYLPDYALGIQSSWEVDFRGRLRNKKKAAQLRLVASQEGRNWLRTSLIAEVANLYYELLALDNEIMMVQKTISLQEYALSIVSLQKSAAHANELAVKQFEAQLLNSKSIEIELRQTIVETENQLNFLLGRMPQPIVRNAETFRKSMPASIQTGVPSQLLRNRPDIREAESLLLASKADVRAARAAFYPSVVINGSYGWQAFNTSYLFSTPESMAFGLFGNLVAPLVNRNAIKAEFKSAKAAQLEAMYQYQKTILNSFIEVQNQLSGFNNMEKIVEQKQQEVDVLTLSIETSTELFKTGRATYLEVLMTQRNALIANIELLEARKRQYRTTINLYKALGGGWKN